MVADKCQRQNGMDKIIQPKWFDEKKKLKFFKNILNDV